MALSYIVKQVKLYKLCKITGYPNQVDLVLDVIDEPLCPAICLACDYSEAMEPKTRKGWCPVCEQHTMVSALVLAGVFR